MVQKHVPSDSIADTARWTAAVRAAEQARDDRLVDDPWAEILAGDEGRAWFAARPPGSTLPIVLRTRYFDDWLRIQGAGARDLQVVLLAAGLDTRAWRIPWPEGTILYELDRAAVLHEKGATLRAAGAVAACERVEVPADLAGPWGPALLAAGLDPGRPTVWLAEGVLFYLPRTAVDHVLETVTRLAAPGSRLGFDIPNDAVLTSPWTKAWVDMQAAEGAPWIGTMADPRAELGSLGWDVSVTQPGDGDTGHGRWSLPLVPAAARDLPHSWWVTAERLP